MASVAIWTAPLCAGGTFICRVADFSSCTWHDVIQNDRGGCTLVLPADSAAVAHAQIMNVIRITDDPDALGNVGVYEYRITALKDGAMLETVTVDAQDLSADLGRVKLSLTIGGLPSFTFKPVPMTPTSFINTYVLPALAAAGITWVALGTITPTALYSIQWDHSTPLAQLAALENATLFEFWLSRNGDTNYLINLGLRSAAGSPVAWVGRNVETLERQILADQYFYNRATPFGATLAGETEATHIGQHGWKLSAVAGSALTLANPMAGGAAPIGADAQLDGLVAGVSLDPVHPPSVGVGSGAGGDQSPTGFTYDPTRRTIWWTMPTGFGQVFWHDLRDGTSGVIVIAGSVAPKDCVYDAGRDEVLVACNDAAKIERIAAGTRVSSGNYACNANPSTLTDLNLFGINQLAIGFTSGAHGIELVNLATLVHLANLDTEVTIDNFCIYDPSTTRYFQLSPSITHVPYYSAAFANLGNMLPGGSGPGLMAAALISGVIHAIERTTPAQIRTFNCSTAAVSAFTALAAFDGVTLALLASAYGQQRILPYLGSRIHFYAASRLVLLDPSSSYAITAGIRIADGAASVAWFYDATDDLIGHSDGTGAAFLLYRNGGTIPSGRLRMAASATTFATQQVSVPGATKGPVLAGQIAEFRADTADTYSLTLKDPASVALYGPIDAFPQYSDLYKRNYKRDPQFDEWAAFGSIQRPRWLGIRWPDPNNVPSIGTMRWTVADAQASARTTSGQIDGAQVLARGIVSLNLKSLAVGRVLQPGDVIYWTNGAKSYFVLARVVVTGTGQVTVSCFSESAITTTNNDAVSVFSPAQTDAFGDGAVVFPLYGLSGGALNPWAPSFHAGVHIPLVPNATSAWIRLRFLAMNMGANLDSVGVNFGGYGAGLPALMGPNIVGGSRAAPAWTPFVLEQQVSLAVGVANGDNYLSVTGVMPVGSSPWVAPACLVLYLQSIEVYIATAASCPVVGGAVPGGELAAWISANNLLFGLSRSTPSFAYTVKFLEDGIKPAVGQACILRDPARGIAAAPRIVRVDYTINRDAMVVNEPAVQLASRRQSSMEGLVQAGF
jgi:hypothetical protein